MLRWFKEVCFGSETVEFVSAFGLEESVERLKAATRRSVFAALARQLALRRFTANPPLYAFRLRHQFLACRFAAGGLQTRPQASEKLPARGAPYLEFTAAQAAVVVSPFER